MGWQGLESGVNYAKAVRGNIPAHNLKVIQEEIGHD